MKKLLFLLCFLFLNVKAHSATDEKPIIISGFDDVLRQAENTGLLKAAIKILEKDKTFTGMPELYTTISQNENDPHFYIISAISTLFDQRIENFLRDSQFPENQRFLRNWVTQRSIEDFKIAMLNKILTDRSDRKFIVIFDNSKPSLALAETLKAHYSDKILSVYLREVVEKPMPKSAIPFYTAFDIAFNEHLKNRMTSEEVNEVGNAILKETKVEKLFPSYAACPISYNPCINATIDTKDLCEEVHNHVVSLCRTRVK